ncbi:putative ABC transporter ATP-binding protein [Halalkalicoccus paucihalophilus]|uniref:Putative ABC transporter ATP-binding protein n=1 Tax=Halalkalicoccus paucihalophilus TaxID=1008153 RepID=A0A151AGY0_9EURY|nr:putative ABC transporter ATP-binding protein [Halalkalicoccus paucihalophilus]
MSHEPLLRIEDVVKRYDEETALDGVSLTMDRGDVGVLIGPSGSGKSTLLRCVNRLTEIDGGEIYLDGDLVSGPDTDVDELRRQVGMVFQDFNLFSHLTARGNIELGLRRVRGMSKEDARRVADEQLEQVSIARQADSYPAELSGG